MYRIDLSMITLFDMKNEKDIVRHSRILHTRKYHVNVSDAEISNFAYFLIRDIILHSSIPIARIGEPEAPTSFRGVIMNVNFSLLNLYKLHRFSTTRI